MTHRPAFEMVRDRDIKVHFISFFLKDEFGFSNQVATALYNDQLFQSKKTISKFSDGKTDNIWRSLCRDSGLPVAELAVTRLKVLAFWIRHQDRTGRMVGVT